MTSLARNISYHNKKSVKFLSKALGIVLVLNIILYLISFRAGNGVIGTMDGDRFSIAGSNCVLITMATLLVYSHEMINERVLLLYSFNKNRDNLIKSVFLDTLWVVFILSLFQTIVHIIDPIIINKMGISPILDYGFINIAKDSIFYIFTIVFLINLFFSIFLHLLYVFYLKYGLKVWVMVFMIIMMFRNGQIDLGGSFDHLILMKNANTESLVVHILGTIILSILLKYSIENLEI